MTQEEKLTKPVESDSSNTWRTIYLILHVAIVLGAAFGAHTDRHPQQVGELLAVVGGIAASVGCLSIAPCIAIDLWQLCVGNFTFACTDSIVTVAQIVACIPLVQ